MKANWLFALLLGIGIGTAQAAPIDANALKQQYKYHFITDRPYEPIVWMGDRYEADAMLELAEEGYTLPNTQTKLYLRPSQEMLLIMPRIDLLQKHIHRLASTTQHLNIFLMDGDVNAEPYGDRSYESYVKSGMSKDLPANVRVFELKNMSVTSQSGKNGFEFPSNIRESEVWHKQIKPLFERVNTVKQNYPSQSLP